MPINYEKSFEEYMQTLYMEEYPMTLDDEISDSYNDWLGNLDESDILSFANQMLKEMTEDGFQLGEATRTSRAVRLADTFRESNGLNV